jgi:formate dehydrogenase iron-sulfur subunit
MHCLEPACVSGCLVGSMTRTAEGIIVYDADKCIGCRYCMLACPFHVPRYEWDKTVPFIQKCEMCHERIRAGKRKRPACVEACEFRALEFGDRDALLKDAHARVRSGKYIQRVWGESEFGGTSVLYISDRDLAPIGFADPNAKPIPSLTEPLIHTTPFIGLGVAATLLGVHWAIGRRMRLMQAPAATEGQRAGPSHASKPKSDETRT